MGIYDRDYIRNRPQPPGYGGPGRGIPPLRTWSINTWLIVLCVGIFVIDGFMQSRLVYMKTIAAQDVDLSSFDQNDILEQDPVKVNQYSYQATLRHRGSGSVLGWRIYQPMQPLAAMLHFSTERGFLGFQFWRFIGFQFLHVSFGHLAFNMIGLYFFGSMIERHLGSKRYLAFYLLAGICGAMMYLILNLGGVIAATMSQEPVQIPGLLFNETTTPLLGASAGVFGVLMAGAYLAPSTVVYLFLIIPIPLRTLAYVLVIIALISVITGGTNAGGEAGHLGGALAGWYFIRHPRHLQNFFDVLGRIDPTSHHYRGERARFRSRATAKINRQKGSSHAEVDRILDKVHDEGLASLTEKEKRILRKASEHR